MTQFEILILIIIYMFCYGFTVAPCLKEDNVWLRLYFVITSLALAIYAPIIIGGMLYEKLEEKTGIKKTEL